MEVTMDDDTGLFEHHLGEECLCRLQEFNLRFGQLNSQLACEEPFLEQTHFPLHQVMVISRKLRLTRV